MAAFEAACRGPSPAPHRLHLRLQVFLLQRHHLLDVLGAHQLLREFERVGDVLLGEAHRLLAHVLGAGLGAWSPVFPRGRRPSAPPSEAVDGLARLFDALLGELAHLGRNLEVRTGHWPLCSPCPAPVPIMARNCHICNALRGCHKRAGVKVIRDPSYLRGLAAWTGQNAAVLRVCLRCEPSTVGAGMPEDERSRFQSSHSPATRASRPMR